MLRGFRPAGGKFAQARIYSPKEPDCIYPYYPEDGLVNGDAAYGYISGQMCSIVIGTS